MRIGSKHLHLNLNWNLHYFETELELAFLWVFRHVRKIRNLCFVLLWGSINLSSDLVYN